MNSKACQNSSEEAQASLLVPLRLVRFFTGDCQQGTNLMLSVLLICHLKCLVQLIHIDLVPALLLLCRALSRFITEMINMPILFCEVDSNVSD